MLKIEGSGSGLHSFPSECASWSPAELSLSSVCKKGIQEASSLKAGAFCLRNYNVAPLTASLLFAVPRLSPHQLPGEREWSWPGCQRAFILLLKFRACPCCPVLAVLFAGRQLLVSWLRCLLLVRPQGVQSVLDKALCSSFSEDIWMGEKPISY